MTINATEGVQCLSYNSNVAHVLYTRRSTMSFKLELKRIFFVCMCAYVCAYVCMFVCVRLYACVCINIFVLINVCM